MHSNCSNWNTFQFVLNQYLSWTEQVRVPRLNEIISFVIVVLPLLFRLIWLFDVMQHDSISFAHLFLFLVFFLWYFWYQGKNFVQNFHQLLLLFLWSMESGNSLLNNTRLPPWHSDALLLNFMKLIVVVIFFVYMCRFSHTLLYRSSFLQWSCNLCSASGFSMETCTGQST